jgi:CDP-4-dehydro-6-deoxyglucose reductase
VALPPTFDARIVSGRMLSPSVRELVCERVDGAPFAFEAGQWVSLVLPHDESDLRRAYSIASAPDGTPRFALAITHVANGPGSSYLHGVAPGEIIKAIGPQGFFTRASAAKKCPSLFVATGTGVTPFRSMILDALAANDGAPLWLLFGVRHEADLLYRDELDALVAAHPNLRVEITLSQPEPSWTGRRGYVQTHVRELWDALAVTPRAPADPGAHATHAYICGLERMVGSVRALLRKEMNVPRERVHSERYD